jgi:hypothetical protein
MLDMRMQLEVATGKAGEVEKQLSDLRLKQAQHKLAVREEVSLPASTLIDPS